MRGFTRHIICILAIFICSLQFHGQTIKELERQKVANKKKIAQTQKEIKSLNKLIKNTNNITKASLEDKVLLESKIEKREQVIGLIEKELKIIDDEIAEKSDKIEKLEEELNILKNDYAKMLIYAYKNRNSYDKLLFILSAESINQAYKRLKYMQQISEYRLRQVMLIEKTTKELEQQVAELEEQKKRKIHYVQFHVSEKEQIAIEKRDKEDLIRTLNAKKDQLQKDINNKKKREDKLNKNVIAIIKEINRKRDIERKKADSIRRARLAEKNPNASAPKDILSASPEVALIAKNFELNKGKLPWPVEYGKPYGKFGTYKDPETKLIVENNGLDFITEKGATVRSVFKGEVVAVFVLSGSNKSVIVQHGTNYYSVYTNLEEVYVSTGDKIETKHILGKVLHNTLNDKSILHFEIYKGQANLNPSYWFYK